MGDKKIQTALPQVTQRSQALKVQNVSPVCAPPCHLIAAGALLGVWGRALAESPAISLKVLNDDDLRRLGVEDPLRAKLGLHRLRACDVDTPFDVRRNDLHVWNIGPHCKLQRVGPSAMRSGKQA